MASDSKKDNTTPAPKPAPKKEASKDKSSPDVTPAKAESGEKPAAAAPAAAAPSSYSRGEGQKPVSQAYKDNWNAIFTKKTKPKKKR